MKKKKEQEQAEREERDKKSREGKEIVPGLYLGSARVCVVIGLMWRSSAPNIGKGSREL